MQDEKARLVRVLHERELRLRDAVDRLRDLDLDGTDEQEEKIERNQSEVRAIAALLREASVLVGCLRRMTDKCASDEIFRAFGAPGDFGYDTPVGDALYAFYRAPSPESTSPEAAG